MTRIENLLKTVKALDKHEETHLEQMKEIDDLKGMEFLARTHCAEVQNILLLDIAKSLAMIADAFYAEEEE